MFDVFKAKYNAWQTEQFTDAEVRGLQCRTRLAHARQALADAEREERESARNAQVMAYYQAQEVEIEARRRVATAQIEAQFSLTVQALEARQAIAAATLRAEEEETKLLLHRTIRAVPLAYAREILGAEIETERLLAEREYLRTQRVQGTWRPEVQQTQPLPALPSAPQSNAIEPAISDKQIEALAQRAIVRFSGLPPEEAQQAWKWWQEQLPQRLPRYAAEEVANRARELRSLL